ncbi:N-acyl homoserine lactonase AttM [Aspergillus udagawae]|uniref:N-acyl homoserine lactonase AttM n=1 Tax=Aspergillus udagawae TaxID=91492 RepID=A0ABQ1AV88_9EURO|nr:N-acyl homoserine lactonase AttM [Aspergillus udagawae]GFF88655.1 N-acyl homoserine lactonase AttM [Aspergillus udagawae]GFG17643.1 N-acyl homoserine lactonase AttM [Aspergillus udagawae]
MDAEKDIATILQEVGGYALDDIDSIIWSHGHTDHIGDPSTFPPSTELVVGSGFKDAILPGYPADPNGVILESDYAGRQLREISFESGLEIGHFRAVDFFGDGSFYLLEAPGHAVGHMCALARTTPTTFIFMGADGCHHCGCLRPNKHVPLPTEISPSPFSTPPYLPGTICPGALLESIHPNHSQTMPYYSQLSAAPGRDVAEAEATISKMASFDASEDVFVIIAHDKSLSEIIDFFPNKANDWKEKGWKIASRWRFLADFQDATSKSSVA